MFFLGRNFVYGVPGSLDTKPEKPKKRSKNLKKLKKNSLET